jgi:two-component system phosphate regulon sensor histidine kinase PhoR
MGSAYTSGMINWAPIAFVDLSPAACCTAIVAAAVALWSAFAGGPSFHFDAGTILAAGMFSGWRPGRGGQDKSGDKIAAPMPEEPTASLIEIVQALDIAAIVVDVQRRIVAFNRHAADLFPAITTGHPVAVASRNPELMQSIDRVFTDGQTDTTEITERMLQGRRFIVTASPLSGPMLLLQFRDTSEQSRLAQLRADFIANASHELRTPLASIKGFIETLQGPARDDVPARTRFLDIMATQSQRMNRILDDLLSLSRIEMRAHLKPEGEVDMSDVIAQVIRSLEPLAREADVTLSSKPTATVMRVRGDRDELEQVMQNLVHNAIKYGRKGGTVEIEVSERAASKGRRHTLAISVKDEGPGIAPEHLPRLTERFYRVDTARSREKGGTGLGLAIVKHILNRHRGELEISSEVGRGSQFTVVLEALSS